MKLKVIAGGATPAVGVDGTAPGMTMPAGMLVANHISWLDIFVINALAPAAFVSKDEVRQWPLIGWLCERTETIFLSRGSRAAAQRTRGTMIAQLRDGVPVTVFPEGTTTAGDRVLPFHAALFQGAIDARVPVVPLALRYVDATDNRSPAPAYDGDVTLWQCLVSIVRAGGLAAQVRVLAPLDSAAADRRHLSARCHHAIAWHLGHAAAITPSPSAAPSGRMESGIRGDPRGAPPSDCHPTDNPSPAPAGYPSA